MPTRVAPASSVNCLDFCRTLGGSPRQVTFAVRVPTALAWTFTALPNAVSFALIGVVISEFVGATTGIGYLMIVSLSTLNASEMFAALTALSVVGVALVFAIQRWSGGCCTGRRSSATVGSDRRRTGNGIRLLCATRLSITGGRRS